MRIVVNMKKREYYEPQWGTGKSHMVLFALFGVAIPLIIPCIAMAFLMDLFTTTVSRALFAVIGTIVILLCSFVWLVLAGKFWGEHTDKKYRLRVPDADKYVHIKRLSAGDGDLMDELDRRGSLFFYHEPDPSFLKYVFNLFKDYDLLKGADLTFYEITKEVLYSHFTYFEKDYKAPETMYVLPYDVLNGDAKIFRTLKKDSVLFLYFGDYTDMLDGIVNKPYGYVEYRYKGIRTCKS